MTRLLHRLLLPVLMAAAAMTGPAVAQTYTITDGQGTKSTSCTSYQPPALGSATITFSPAGCLGLTTTGNDPVFSVRTVPVATTQPATGTTGVQTVLVFVDADRDVPTTTTYNLTFNLCTSAQGCTSSGSGNWYFFRYAELGGAGFTAQDRVTTGNFPFTFQAGANTSPTNLRSMGVGHFDVPNSPLFSGTRNVMFSLSGTQAATNVVTHTITGGQQLAGDFDINGNPIPAPSGPAGSRMCEYAGQTPYPGAGGGPCGAYEIPVGECTSGMSGSEAITRAWMYILEDYQSQPLTPRVGNPIYLALPRNNAMVFRMKTGPAANLPETTVSPFYRGMGFNYEEQVATHGPMAPRFVTLSEKKCDFDYAKTLSAGALNGCFKNMSGSDGLLGRIWGGSPPSPSAGYPYCPLKPDTVYYLNIRYEDASTIVGRGKISCPIGQGPGGLSVCGSAIVTQ